MSGFFVAFVLALLALGYALGPSDDALTTTSDGTVVPDTTQDGTSNANQTGTFMYSSDGTLTGTAITNDPASWPGADSDYPNAKVWNICAAVALAEGYNQGVGTAPYDLNNPGDLSPGDEAGQATCGAPQNHGGSAIILFCTVESGFIALYKKFDNIVNGRSTVYPKSLTWTQVSQKYAGNAAAWLTNVTNYLGVDIGSTPADYAA